MINNTHNYSILQLINNLQIVKARQEKQELFPFPIRTPEIQVTPEIQEIPEIPEIQVTPEIQEIPE
jgi:hypothetical protein